MVVLDGCCFIRLVGFWLGYAKVSKKLFKFNGLILGFSIA
ncbi:hypothetical protein [uncultured Gammaproteobacteria bacterium]|nr:hypothetical protein [uncultured Gammaproteobacteria bacterium]